MAHGDKILLGDLTADVNVSGALRGDRRLPAEVRSDGGQVIVTNEDAGLGGKGEDLLDRAVEGGRVAAGEVGPGGAVVRHEQGIADKGGVANPVGHAGWRMTRGVNCSDRKAAQG